MARRIESLFVAGPAGKLEALLEEPEERDPEQAALVCHPHPLHGGTMHNKVVHRVARGLRHAGHVVMRFNFRGVNLSEGKYGRGIGEVEDAKAALDTLRERYPQLPFTLAGFSFGSRVVLKLAQQSADARRAIAVGFPAAYPNSEELIECPVPRIFVHSRVDAICSPQAAYNFYESLPGAKQFHWLEGHDHFFSGALPQLERLMVELG